MSSVTRRIKNTIFSWGEIMRKLLIVCAVAIVAVGMIAAPASATYFTDSSLLARADCEGFLLRIGVYHSSAVDAPTDLKVFWEVNLFEQSDLVNPIKTIPSPSIAIPIRAPFSVDIPGTWDMELCGTYIATAYIKIVDADGNIWRNYWDGGNNLIPVPVPGAGENPIGALQEYTFTSEPIVCDCDTGGCTRTQGYWKNHPDAWPVPSITVGGVTYSKEAAIDIMNNPGRGDKTYDMFRQLVAAMLNDANGTDISCISAAISSADAWFVTNHLGSNVRANSAAWKDEASGWHDSLDDYNNGRLGCADHCEDGDGGPGIVPAAKPAKAPKIKNFPNPFNPITTLEFTLPETGFARVEIYNMLGERIDTLVERSFQAGTYTVEWDASRYATGTYFYRLTTANHSVVQKILFVK